MADPTNGSAATTTPAQPVLDDEAKALQLEQFKAEARKAIAEADAGAFSAGLYQPKTTAAKGVTTLDDKADSLLTLVALRNLSNVAEVIGNDILNVVRQGATVLIVDSRQLALSDAARVEIGARFEWFEAELPAALAPLNQPKTATPQPAGAEGQGVKPEFVLPALPLALQAGQGILSAVGLAGDIVSMFKTDYNVQGRAIPVDQTALAAAVAGRLTPRVGVVVDAFQTLEHSSTLTRFRDLLKGRTELEQKVQEVDAAELSAPRARIERLAARIAALTTSAAPAAAAAPAAQGAQTADVAPATTGPPTPQDIDAEIDRLESEIANLATPAYLERSGQVAAAKSLIAAFDHYAVSITAGAADAPSPLISAALRDVLHDGITAPDQQARPIDYVLYLAVANSGGDITTQSGIFANNDKLQLTAGLQATYLLADRSGLICAGGSLGATKGAAVELGHHKIEWFDGDVA